MRASLYWIDLEIEGHLAIAARPRSGDWLEDEISAWGNEHINIVVSLLEKHEVRDLDLEKESDLCRSKGIHFKSFPISDREVPKCIKDVKILIENLNSHLRNGDNIVIHCRAGIGRSSLIAACVLASFGISPAEAFEKIRQARKLNVPDTDVQRDWVFEFSTYCL